MLRDLKSDNILCFKHPSTGLIVNKLADFGLAKLLSKNAMGQFYATTITGTVLYMAPEIVKAIITGDPKYGASADIWSLGKYFLLRTFE